MTSRERARAAVRAELEAALAAPPRERRCRLRRLVRLMLERCVDLDGLAREVLAGPPDELPEAG